MLRWIQVLHDQTADVFNVNTGIVVLQHCPKLVHNEGSASFTNSLLPIEDWTGRSPLDKARNQEHQGSDQKDTDRSHKGVSPLCGRGGDGSTLARPPAVG